MNTFVLNYKISWIAFICYSACLFSLSASLHAQTQVEKIFYHVMKPNNMGNKLLGTSNKKKDAHDKTLELAKLVLYFSDSFLISQLPDGIVPQSKGRKTLAFILPGVGVAAGDVQKELNKYAALDERHFRFSVAPINVPTKGLSIKIAYEPEWIEVAVHEFKTIGNQQALVITCYDKKCIENLKSSRPTVLQMASLQRPTIVVDCGHGGDDTGACGFFNIKEKELVKKIGDQLEHELKKRGWFVVMTRKGDEFVPLDKRTFKINSEKSATVALSLHANSGKSDQAQGIETFYYDPVLLTENIKNSIDISFSTDMSDNTCKLSKDLAHCMQTALLSSVSHMNPDVIDRTVKQGTAQVLMGSSIPAVLVEMGFVSHRKEARLLANQEYQKLIVAGLVAGLEKFVEDVKKRVS